MSFKRAGDDHCALRLQKKRRVAALFAEDIPADEVSQTRSGKYVCLVCPHNPVLDTMPMLSMHRQGRKHLANMSVKIEKEHNLNELVQKQRQELYLKEASVVNEPSNVRNTTSSFVNDISQTAPLLAKTKELKESIVRGHLKSNGEKSVSESQINVLKNEELDLGKTNIAKFCGFPNEQPQILFKKNIPFFQSRIELKLSSDFKNNVRNANTSPFFSDAASASNKKIKCGGDDGYEKFQKSSTVNNTANRDSTEQTNFDNKKSPEMLKCSPDKVTDGDKKIKKGKSKMNTEEQKKYLELKMAGWILDSNGKWVKDENVEFDSDEEPPYTK